MNKEKKTSNKIKIIGIVSAIAIIVGLCLTNLHSSANAIDVEQYFVDSDKVKVKEDNKQYLFDGPGEDNLFIFYPGARIDEKAYAPLLYTLAENGLDTYLVKFPFRYGIFGVNKAKDVINNYSYKHYYLGGHSLGGATATLYANKESEKITGLIYLAAYSTKDISNKNFGVLSIYGTNDGVMDQEDLEKNKKYMPLDYTEYAIEGGNHAQFGSYGSQRGDNEATITSEEQRALTVAKIISWINR